MAMEVGCPLHSPLFCLLWIMLIFPSCFGCIFLVDSTNNPEGHSLLKKLEHVHGTIRSILAEDSNQTKNMGDGKKEQDTPIKEGSKPEDHAGANVTKSAGMGESSNHTDTMVEERGGNSQSKQPKEKNNTEKEKDTIDLPDKKPEKENQKDSCDPAHSCTVNALLACLRISGDGTQMLSLYLQNQANQVISVKVITPLLWKADPSQLSLQNKQDPKTVSLEIKGHIGGAADNVTLEVEGETCSIKILDQHLDGVVVVQDKGFSGFTYSDAFTPMAAGVYTLFFLVLLGSGTFFYCKCCKRGQRHDDGAKYHELEMGLPNTTRKGKGTRDASIDGWDEVWDDGWDDTDTDTDLAIATPTHTPTSTSAPPTTTITITSSSTSSTSVINDAPSNVETARPSPRFLQSLSSKGLATRRVNKDGWDTWDD